MILDGALAETKVRGNVLAGVSGKDERHDLMLTWRELFGKPARSQFAALDTSLARVPPGPSRKARQIGVLAG